MSAMAPFERGLNGTPTTMWDPSQALAARLGAASAVPASNFCSVGPKPGYLLCGPGDAEWSAKMRIDPGDPPTASLVFGLLDSVLTPGSAYSPSSPSRSFRRRNRQTGRVSPLTLATRNVRSLLDNPRSNRPERRAALVARELARYKVDIAALSETRFSEQGQLEEVGAGYIFFWSGRPRAERQDAGVAFATLNDIVGRLPSLPQGINDRLMSLRLPLRAVYGPPPKGTAPLLSACGGTLPTEKKQNLQRWTEHFRGVLNCPSAISDAAIDRLPQVETNVDLDLPPSRPENIRAVQQPSSGKAPGSVAIPAEVYKHGGP
nr:unnamed protein product [Spirometra erinaceieuropaei]